jgi:hypothetical protein
MSVLIWISVFYLGYKLWKCIVCSREFSPLFSCLVKKE